MSIKIKQIDHSTSQPGSVIAYDGQNNVWLKLNYHQVINYVDLDSSNSIIIAHNLNRKYVQFSLYDENDHLIIPDDVILLSNNTLKLCLPSFRTSVSNWNLVLS